MNNFVFTCGDTNGIGPEIVIKTLNKLVRLNSNNRYFFICPVNIFHSTTKNIKPEFTYSIVDSLTFSKTISPSVIVYNSGNAKQSFGKPTITSGKSSYNSIKLSFNMLRAKLADAVITAPISKKAINLAGVNFPGHTEMYANWCKTENYVMTFLSKKLCTALVTIHKPIKEISKLLNKRKLESVINVLINALHYDLRINDPSIAVLGLNPHAGETGLIGKEEKEIILPAIKKCSRSISIEGPFSPDAFFARKLYKNYDIVLGMYHDQVLIPFKLLNSSGGVNYTAGLPIVRTSPDHGVAYDIASAYRADESSMLQAFSYAEKIVINRKKRFAEKYQAI